MSNPRIISLDTETTGTDLYHGARPFFVTIAKQDGSNLWWQWGVDPGDRGVSGNSIDPAPTKEDLLEIQREIDNADSVVTQNGKFDVSALSLLYQDHGLGFQWDWSRCVDTLLAGHLLASNQPHDLTSMALHYLGVDIQPYEDRMQDACNEARRIVRRQYPDWRIAEKGLEEMPSAKEKCWKYDTWLPRLLAGEIEGGPVSGIDSSWLTITSEYANADSSVTLALWPTMEAEIRHRGLWEIYQTRLKLLPITYEMERRGASINKPRLEKLTEDYSKEREKLGAEMLRIAADYGYTLELPKGATPNKSLRQFCFNVMKLEPIYNPKAKTSEPTLDSKLAIPHYLVTLETGSRELAFISALTKKRGLDTDVTYLNAYKRFWSPDKEAQARYSVECLHAAAKTGASGVLVPPTWFTIRSKMNPTGTDTLRWSSGEPNVQNVKKKEDGEGITLRYCFGPSTGREWWSLDAKNIELRIPAYECGEKDLIDLFERVNEPPYYGSEHLLNFSTVYPDIWEQELKEVGIEKVGPHCKKKYKDSYYQWCKNGGFAVGYGAIDTDDGEGTADRAFHKPGAHALLKSRFAKKEALNQKWIKFAERNGYVETIPDRSVCKERGYPLLCTRTEWGRILPTVPLNYHVQSTAMWWMSKAMIRCHAKLREWNRQDTERGLKRGRAFDGFITLQVHDELVFDLPKAAHPKKDPLNSNLWRVKVLQSLMEKGGGDIGIPTPVSIEYHESNWSEGVTL